MRRYHLFEFEDLDWFPSLIRNYMTDFLQFVSNQFDFYKGIIPILKKGLLASSTNTIIDLASGGGGGWKKLAEHLQAFEEPPKVVLTDRFPNITAFQKLKSLAPSIFEYENTPIDALYVPPKLQGLRTQFLSLHHFQPEQVKQIFSNAVEQTQPIAVFEGQERNLSTAIQFFFSPINVFLTTPFIRPFRLGRIIFTYLIPIVPLCVMWDGVVSVLRTYKHEEIKPIIESIDATETFHWEYGKAKSGLVTISYVLGRPKSAE